VWEHRSFRLRNSSLIIALDIQQLATSTGRLSTIGPDPPRLGTHITPSLNRRTDGCLASVETYQFPQVPIGISPCLNVIGQATLASTACPLEWLRGGACRQVLTTQVPEGDGKSRQPLSFGSRTLSLSAVSGAPRATVRDSVHSEGRFRYSDLKEAALMEAYVL